MVLLDRNRSQFSVRDLLTLTVVVSVFLAIGVLSRGSRYFGAFSSPWALATLVLMSAVWGIDRWRFFAPRTLALASVALFGLSLALPAVALKNFFWTETMIWGWQAFYVSFVGIPETMVQLWGEWNLSGSFAYIIGAAVNLAYLIAVAAFWIARKKPRALTLSHRAATLATILALLVLIPLCLSAELATFYPGYGLWAASILSLALGARRHELGVNRSG